jgi:hypothetical protein
MVPALDKCGIVSEKPETLADFSQDNNPKCRKFPNAVKPITGSLPSDVEELAKKGPHEL